MRRSSDIQEYNEYLINNSKKIAEFSTSKTENTKVNYLYGYIIFKNDITLHDGDFWDLGGGNHDIQTIVNNFKDTDWNDLISDINYWQFDYLHIIIEAIGFGFDGAFSVFLDESQVQNAAHFYLSLFINCTDIDIRNSISYFSFLINKSDTNSLKKLSTMRNWLLDNKYDSEIWMNSKFSPLRNIEEAISKATKN
ncbi:hypothetical protein [Kordia sp.]|uniref:hypothetical protein n=1 Tax=Kordia sp. TaxID=1965332 RepID=UPI003D6A8563